MGELDLDTVGIDEVEHCSDTPGYFPDLRSRDTRGIKPTRPFPQAIQRLGLEREMIQTCTHGVEPFTGVVRMLAQVEYVATQGQNRRPSGEATLVLTLGGIRHQEICAEHVAIETNAALEVGHRNPKVMKSGQARPG